MFAETSTCVAHHRWVPQQLIVHKGKDLRGQNDVAVRFAFIRHKAANVQIPLGDSVSVAFFFVTVTFATFAALGLNWGDGFFEPVSQNGFAIVVVILGGATFLRAAEVIVVVVSGRVGDGDRLPITILLNALQIAGSSVTDCSNVVQ